MPDRLPTIHIPKNASYQVRTLGNADTTDMVRHQIILRQ